MTTNAQTAIDDAFNKMDETFKSTANMRQRLIDKLINAVDKYVSEESGKVDETKLKKAAEKTKELTSSKLMNWIDRITYEMETLLEKHVVSLR